MLNHIKAFNHKKRNKVKNSNINKFRSHLFLKGKIYPKGKKPKNETDKNSWEILILAKHHKQYSEFDWEEEKSQKTEHQEGNVVFGNLPESWQKNNWGLFQKRKT